MAINMGTKKRRADQTAGHAGEFKKNKAKIFKTQTICGICGRPVDMSLTYPHPLAKTLDHIIPVAKGGHPSSIDNMQLAHWTCNRQKSDSLQPKAKIQKNEVISNRVLPHSIDWKQFHTLH